MPSSNYVLYSIYVIDASFWSFVSLHDDESSCINNLMILSLQQFSLMVSHINAQSVQKKYNIDTSFWFSSRYADRAKKIKNNAVVNENPIDKLIRELKVIQKCIKFWKDYL